MISYVYEPRGCSARFEGLSLSRTRGQSASENRSGVHQDIVGATTRTTASLVAAPCFGMHPNNTTAKLNMAMAP
jgi:hypothetical protein